MSVNKFQRTSNLVTNDLHKTTTHKQIVVSEAQSRKPEIFTGKTQKRMIGIKKQGNLSLYKAQNNVNNCNGKKQYQYEELKKDHKNYKEEFLIMLLNRMFFRRKSYSFQVIKQFYLFPDETISSDMTVNSYDRLFFNDETIHTLVKIYETKELEAKLWAFINLKTLHIKKKLEKFTSHYQNVQKKIVRKITFETFTSIRQYSLEIRKNTVIQNSNTNKVFETKETRVISSRSRDKIIQAQRNNSPPRVRVINTSRSPYSTASKRIQSPTVGARIIYPAQPSQTITSDKTTEIRRQVEVNRYHTDYNSNKGSQTSRIIRVEQHSPQMKTPYTLPNKIQYSPSANSTLGGRIYRQNTIQQNLAYKHCTSQHNCIHYCQKCQKNSLQSKEESKKSYQKQLVHTVNGDCTINIYNNCTIDQGEKIKNHNNKEKQKEKGGILHAEMHYKSCCCCCTQLNSKVKFEFDDDGYCLQQRIQYLKKLEALNQKMNHHKF